MISSFKTVDIFAGPGGLAEGFSSLRDASGQRVFDISLSVEKEKSAFATLRLRAFTRQFSELPDSYFDYIAKRISREQLIEKHSDEWEAAVRETALLELGSENAREWLPPVLENIRETAKDRTILIGGPPCQAYSLVGRARNQGIADYDAAADHRHFLYREYIHILEQLQPVAFVMENVKGMLSAKVDGVGMIERIMDDLRSAGGKPDNYHILPLVADTRGKMSGHIVRAEDFGIPQARHRVILLGIRTDVFNQCGLQDGEVPALAARPVRATVRNVLEGMPRLRSGLSRTVDTPDGWRTAVMGAFRDAATACEAHTTDLGEVVRKLRHHAGKMLQTDEIPPRVSTNPAPIQDNRLAAWLVDPVWGTSQSREPGAHGS
jgi:DNA (cytosine-5)-methyltransferase 1